MRFIFLILTICLYHNTVLAQAKLYYDINNNSIHILSKLNNNSENEIEIGTGQIEFEMTDTVNSINCVLYSIGCSQYSIVTNDEGVDMTIYSWPTLFHHTDCACEDIQRPEKNDAELILSIHIRNNNISAQVTFNQSNALYGEPDSYDENVILEAPNDYVLQFESIIHYYLSTGIGIYDILSFINKFNNKINVTKLSEEEYKYYLYLKNVYSYFLPLSGKKIDLEGLIQLAYKTKELIQLQ